MTLKVSQIVKHFSGIKAVDGVSFEVATGECVALIGPNGAGKSTCFACIAGQYAAGSGQISWRGQSLAALTPAARLRLGLARTFQVAQVFEALTVLQNVQLAARAGRGGSAISALKMLDSQPQELAQNLLERVGLNALAGQSASDLPYGAKKRLELAIALAPEPQLLLLDEPAAGLAQTERAALMTLVKSLAADGLAVLYTEHNMDAVAQVADRVLVLIEGRVAAQGSFDEISKDPVVQQRYLGRAGAVRA